jgi:hypothetical protein
MENLIKDSEGHEKKQLSNSMAEADQTQNILE